MMDMARLGEFGLIRRIASGIKTDGSVVRGIGDDCAVLRWKKDKYLLATCDMLVEGVHFFSDQLPVTSYQKTHRGQGRGAAPFQIGWKALACGLSDIAAMGGLPHWALVSLGLPRTTKVEFVDEVYRGMRALARRFNVNIVGGNTSRAPKVMIDIVVLGEVEKDNLVLRSGAKVGDNIYVTGALGGSIKGRHLKFVPRIKEARRLVKNYSINAMIDISDGLSSDLRHICKASRVGARIYEALIPVHKDALSINEALHMGEDYELLFTAKRKINSKSIFRIGEVFPNRDGVKLVNSEGREKDLAPKGWVHF